ncbi:MAG TPA: hypothetical protein DIS79_05030 [Bacteroidetes bacterium]|nr:hypothetical protein [Bacteroidota bacterium]HRK03865.1 hypothetical protein [Chlorobiota bacterium]
MASVLTSARYGNVTAAVVAIVIVTSLLASCSSPNDLDVPRAEWYSDGAVHPSRLSIYYYYGDSAYEAIVTDPSLLSSIWLEYSTYPCEITIPQLVFALPDTVTATPEFTPFVRSFSISTERQPADGEFRVCSNTESWIAGDFLEQDGQRRSFKWGFDSTLRQIRVAYYMVPGENLIKGSFQFIVADPRYPSRYQTYRALVTIEYTKEDY